MIEQIHHNPTSERLQYIRTEPRATRICAICDNARRNILGHGQCSYRMCKPCAKNWVMNHSATCPQCRIPVELPKSLLTRVQSACCCLLPRSENEDEVLAPQPVLLERPPLPRLNATLNPSNEDDIFTEQQELNIEIKYALGMMGCLWMQSSLPAARAILAPRSVKHSRKPAIYPSPTIIFPLAMPTRSNGGRSSKPIFPKRKS